MDITPAKDIQIAGDIGRRRPVEEIRDPLYARALVIEGQGKRVCIVQADVTLMAPNYRALDMLNQLYQP